MRATQEEKQEPLHLQKILLIDDNIETGMAQKWFRRALEEAIKDMNFSITCFSNPKDAITEVQEQLKARAPFSLIFMDREMPQMTGEQATGEIRNIEKEYDQTKQVGQLIVGWTAGADNEEVVKGMLEKGVNVVLSKNFFNTEGLLNSLLLLTTCYTAVRNQVNALVSTQVQQGIFNQNAPNKQSWINLANTLAKVTYDPNSKKLNLKDFNTDFIVENASLKELLEKLKSEMTTPPAKIEPSNSPVC